MTKPITSVAFMMLVEEGRVALDDPAHRFIPSWRNLGVYVGGGGGLPGTPPGWLTKPTDAPMRMIDLLRHTSGLTYGFQNRTNVDAAYRANSIDAFERNDGLQGFVDALATVPLEFSPGTAWNYSVSTDVLGYLVQAISGEPFEQFLRSRIFEPLGMHDTAFFVDEAKAARFAQCYVPCPKASSRRLNWAASASRLRRPRAAAGWSPPRPTTCAFANACAAAVNSTARACSARRRWR
jgi:CubicO group peptidase (beta-lactamase class C family)